VKERSSPISPTTCDAQYRANAAPPAALSARAGSARYQRACKTARQRAGLKAAGAALPLRHSPAVQSGSARAPSRRPPGAHAQERLARRHPPCRVRAPRFLGAIDRRDPATEVSLTSLLRRPFQSLGFPLRSRSASARRPDSAPTAALPGSIAAKVVLAASMGPAAQLQTPTSSSSARCLTTSSRLRSTTGRFGAVGRQLSLRATACLAG